MFLKVSCVLHQKWDKEACPGMPHSRITTRGKGSNRDAPSVRLRNLPFYRYVWDVAKSTTRAERLSCAAAMTVLIICIILIVYFTVIAKTTTDPGDVAPHEWFITRDMWLAPAFNTTERTTEFEPLRLVIIAHSVSPECLRFVNCAAELRNLQSYFLRTYQYDLPYNFLIGNDGRVYEARGWNVAGAHTRGYNHCSIGVAFIGDYREGLPAYSKVTQLQLQRAHMLFEEGIKLGHLHKNFEVLGAKDLDATHSPGTNIYNEIRQWANYAHNNLYKDRNCQEIHEYFKDENPNAIATKNAPNNWFISRDMWLAKTFNTTERTTNFEPLRLVIISHTVSPECQHFVNCAAELRVLQSYFITTFQNDLPYNFLIGNDGRVYEGRGWNAAGAHTRGYNQCSMGVAFIGDYREGLPSYSQVTQLQLERALTLFEEGIKLGYLHKNFEVLGAKDLITTSSPGINLYNAIQEWSHYAHNNLYKNRTCQEIHEYFKDVNTTTVAIKKGN